MRSLLSIHIDFYAHVTTYDGFSIIRLKKLCSGGRDRRVSGMDAAKASAAQGARHWRFD
ncbi:hypothetical protein ECA1554 [Pectobacterium atrosepticum SCRI1043]|uniref:Uncharacterized protein n=1 Tax=Pectobacterium atrosepticum (strain SCRI 1043 / ATCC BAA-672) TaxID=218491 RepID=Q6D6X5_PECAS|nr:hypothetical protein ECA1554 [Pectobacterium atrosepticum SCRI1043]